MFFLMWHGSYLVNHLSARFRQHDVHVILGDPFSSVFATLLQAQYLVTLYSAFSWQAQYVLILLFHFGGRRSIW